MEIKGSLPQTDFEIAEKKKFLKKFYWNSKEIEKLEEKLKLLNIKITSMKTSNISSMPKGGLSHDITDLLILQEKYQQQIIKKITKLEKSKQDIESSIDTLEDLRLRLILRYCYLENYTYKEIASDLDKSERHIRRLHDIAIRLIKIIRS
ncbi:MAG: sigma factor-like helix-turn-helix DNA-binding protein [Bacilli bacterium]